MKDISDVTCCVVDTGLFIPMACRMAEACKRVLYWSPDMRGFPSLRQGAIGDGFPNIERVLEFWPHLNDIDLFCFPDIGQSGLQVHLELLGKAVWGSRHGDCLELGRERFMNKIQDLGLDVPSYKVVEGLSNLRVELRDKEDKYIKVSRWRGDFETYHWRTWNLDSGFLDCQAVNFGPLKESIRFLVFDAIETDLEIGGDTYCVDGKWPSLMLNGIEGKDRTYFASVTPKGDMPDQIQSVLDAFAPELGSYHYRNQWSMEVRVKGDKAYFNDATCRGGMPSTGSQQILWKNFPEIIWFGANGELMQPDPAAQFSIECMITCKPDKETWTTVEIDPALEGHCRFSYCGFLDGCYVFPPDEMHHGDLGWLCCTGDTPDEVLKKAKELADLLPDGLNSDVESLASVIKEVDQMKQEGIPFTEQAMPEPAEVL